MLRSNLLAACVRYACAILGVAAALMVGAGEAQQAKGPSKLPLPKADPAPCPGQICSQSSRLAKSPRRPERAGAAERPETGLLVVAATDQLRQRYLRDRGAGCRR